MTPIHLPNECTQFTDVYATPSQSCPGLTYRSRINHFSDNVFCTCEDYRFRHSKHDPGIHDTEHHCKHLESILAPFCEANPYDDLIPCDCGNDLDVVKAETDDVYSCDHCGLEVAA